MTPDVLQSGSTYFRPLVFDRVGPTEESLAAMGFDVHRLSFYAWLVAQGKEPLVEDGFRLSIPGRNQHGDE
jgi:hypothetical protein